MEYEISNEYMKVRISSKGGELRSLQDENGREYLWQGDAATWEDRGPNLFPYIGRMTERTYTYKGKSYHMDIHGFLPTSEMSVRVQEKDRLVLFLDSTESTREQYPFEFSLELSYYLEGRQLKLGFHVENRGSDTMYFAVGGHPGFCVPAEDGLGFEDYYMDFGENAEPLREQFSDDCFVLDERTDFALREKRYLDLRHDLFDRDAIVLTRMPKEVALTAKGASREIRVSYPDMDYLGIWHWPKAEVPYVCIEPWSSLPSRKGIVEDFEKQDNLLSLEPGKEYKNNWQIAVVLRKKQEEK